MAQDRLEEFQKEILKKVRQIEITTGRFVEDIFAGEYSSVFKGRGIEFSEVREYVPGDDVRSIDWNVTARMATPYIKEFNEERELCIMLIVDLSASGFFGSWTKFKSEIAAEIAAILAFSAIRNNDKVGLIVFSEYVERFIPPKKGRKNVLRLIREILGYCPRGKRTNINSALEYLIRTIQRHAIVFIISDFIDRDYEKLLRIANRRNDIIAICLSDPKELELPNIGLIELEDQETGQRIIFDTSNKKNLQAYKERMNRLREERKKRFFLYNIDYIDITLDRSYIQPLIQFFRQRAKRVR